MWEGDERAKMDGCALIEQRLDWAFWLILVGIANCYINENLPGSDRRVSEYSDWMRE